MQSNGCPQHNGTSGDPASTSHQNGACSSVSNGELNDKPSQTKPMSQTDQDIVRLIAQHLRGLGLK